MTRYLTLIALGLVACAGEAEQSTASNTSSRGITVATQGDLSQLADSEAALDTDQANPAEVWTPIGEEDEILASIEIAAETAAPMEIEADPIEPSEFTLRRGETLAHFARWSGMTVESVASSSELDLNGSYPVGTSIRLAIDAEQRSTLEASRDEHHQKRVEGYLASRGGSTGSEFYTVRSGDNAWVIAKNSFGIPVWLLESYNPSVDLDELRPGQSLMVPVIDDVVVSAD
jgi:LysM repeat protein